MQFNVPTVCPEKYRVSDFEVNDPVRRDNEILS